MSRALDASRVSVVVTVPQSAVATERQLMDALIAAARVLGWLVFHVHDSRHSAAGFPDLLMLRGTRCVVAECKSARGKLGRAQTVWLAAFRETDIETYVVYPWDQDWFMAEVLA